MIKRIKIVWSNLRTILCLFLIQQDKIILWHASCDFVLFLIQESDRQALGGVLSCYCIPLKPPWGNIKVALFYLIMIRLTWNQSRHCVLLMSIYKYTNFDLLTCVSHIYLETFNDFRKTFLPRPFGTCKCSTCRDQSFSKLVVVLPDYALPISLGTFSILLYATIILFQDKTRPQKIQKSSVTTQKRHNKLRLHNDCGPT